jgi:hypothetical protein
MEALLVIKTIFMLIEIVMKLSEQVDFSVIEVMREGIKFMRNTL